MSLSPDVAATVVDSLIMASMPTRGAFVESGSSSNVTLNFMSTGFVLLARACCVLGTGAVSVEAVDTPTVSEVTAGGIESRACALAVAAAGLPYTSSASGEDPEDV